MKPDREYQNKLISPDELLGILKPGNRVFLSSGPAMPSRSVEAIVSTENVNI